MNDRICDASLHDLKNGFSFDGKRGVFSCLFCDGKYEHGRIYHFGDELVDARKAAILHIEEAHGSVFSALLSGNKKYTGLTDVQKDYLISFYRGETDQEISKSTNTSLSTVRYQRYSFREKAKQAKLILALSELLEEQRRLDAPQIHSGATMVDERYMTTDSEAERIIKTCFESTDPLKLKIFSSKEKKKLVILKTIAGQFEPGVFYTEKEINDILKAIYDDYATIRRYLIEYGFMSRTANCEKYWLTGSNPQT